MQVFALKISQQLNFENIEYICKLCGIQTDTQNNANKNKTNYKKQLIPQIESYILDTLRVQPICFGVFLFKTQHKKVYYIPTLPVINKAVTEKDILSLTQIKTAISSKTIQLKYKPDLKVPNRTIADLCNKIIADPAKYSHFNMTFSESDDESISDTPMGPIRISSGNSLDISSDSHDVDEDQNQPAPEQFHTPSPNHSMNNIPNQESEQSDVKTEQTSPEYSPRSTPIVTEKLPRQNRLQSERKLLINTTTTSKIPLVDYESEEKNGNVMDWYTGNIFLLTLHGDNLTEQKKIAMILSAMKGDLQRRVSEELQSQGTAESLTLAQFQTALLKVTKKTKTEYSRELERLKFNGGDVKEFYGKILNLVKKLLGNDQKASHESLASTYLKAKCLNSNLNFQLSEKSGTSLVDLATDILNITKNPTISAVNNFNGGKITKKAEKDQNFKKNAAPKGPNCTYCQKPNHSYQECRSRLSGKPPTSRFYQSGTSKLSQTYQRPPTQNDFQGNRQNNNFGPPNNFQPNSSFHYQPRQQMKPVSSHQQNQYTNSPSTFSKPFICHFCTKLGHTARDCHSRARGYNPHPQSEFARRRGQQIQNKQ